MIKVAIFLAQGFEEVEALTVVDIVRRAGITIDMVSISEDYIVESSHRVLVTAEYLLKEYNFDMIDMIILPGGMPGTLNLEKCKLLIEQINKFNQQKKYLAAICAAPSIFGHLGILSDLRACCYPSFENDLIGANVMQQEVCIEDYVITSRGMGTAIAFALAIVSKLLSKEKAE